MQTILKQQALQSKINTVLPIILSIVLPLVTMVSNPLGPSYREVTFWANWIMAVIILYSLWQLIWMAGDFKHSKKTKRYWLKFAIYLSLFFICFFNVRYSNFNDPWMPGIARLFLAMILFGAIQYSLRSQQNISNLRVEKEQLQTENYRAQLKALRTQVDPHFLFNSLNTLRSMVRQNHIKSEQFVMSLSDFYRTTLKHNDNTTLPLSEELNVLESYIFLMKSRSEESIHTEIEIDDHLYTRHLPSLALQMIVENCFKHNSMTAKMPLSIRITGEKDTCIKVCNNLQPKFEQAPASGYGLELLKKRYALLNEPDGLRIEKLDDFFCVKLKLLS